MITSSDLRRIPAFSDLPEDQIEWFVNQLEEVSLNAGETFVRQGDPADWMFIFLEGRFQWTGEFGGDTVSLPAQAGEVSGTFPFSRMKRFSVTGRAVTNARLGRFPAALFSELTQRMPLLTTRLVAMMSDRIREGTRIEQQRDRVFSLGKLSAGFAHELNNPASAAKRASDQMRETLAKMRSAYAELWRCPLDESNKARIEEVESSLLQSQLTQLDGLPLSELEEKLESILRSRGHADSWRFAPALAKCNMPPNALSSLLKDLEPASARAALARIAASAELSVLLNAIENGTARVLNLVRTVAEYTYMDQATVQSLDVTRSLETTLDALAYVLQPGVKVQCSFEPVPVINAVGTELNLVWTNIIENAVEAMAGQGELRVRTFQQDNYAVVEIADSGSGIHPEIKPYIFDPFFTTKGVGEGTGLGLNTVQTIIRKIGGHIQVTSEPGDTQFQVWLPCGDPRRGR